MLRWTFCALLAGLWVWWLLRGTAEAWQLVMGALFVAMAFYEACKKAPFWS